MTEKEILSHYNVNLELFDDDLEREAFYINSLRTIFISSKLTGIDRRKALLHELGHIEHNPKKYHRLLLQYENEADRFMIRELIKDYLKDNDVYNFNWLQFAKYHQISTTWGETMIQEEFRDIIGI